MARMSLQTIEPKLAAQAILLAVAVNTGSKAVMAAWMGGREVGVRVMLASGFALVTAGALHFWLG